MFISRPEPEKSKFGSEMLPQWKQFVVFGAGWIGFQVLAATIQIFLGFLLVPILNKEAEDILTLGNVSMLVNSISYLALLIFLLILINTDIVKLVKSFGQYQSLIAGIICLLAIFGFNILYGSFLNLVGPKVSDNANQTGLNSMTRQYPFTCLIIFGFIGPICEEITYRVGLFSSMKRRSTWLAYLVTILVFALIHFNFSTDPATLLNEVLNLPYYLFAAAAFSFTYDKFGFAASTSAHILNNIFSLLVILF